MIEDVILTFADKGFAYAVACYFLLVSYKQDREYLKVLTEISTSIKEMRGK